MQTMKVQIKVTVEVNAKDWMENYGGMTSDELRKDVQQDVENYLFNHPSEAISPVGR